MAKETLKKSETTKEKKVETNTEKKKTKTETVKTEETATETKKPKKSDLIKEMISLEKQYVTGSNAMLEETYNIKVNSKSNFERLIKFVEHDAIFDNQTATGVVLLYSNFKQQKPFTREKDWNGAIQLKTSSCLILWKALMSFKGKGYYEAKSFLEMIQLVGPELSNAVKTIDNKNISLRGLHSRLNEIDNIIDSNDYESDITEEEEKALREDEQNVIKTEQSIEDEVNPEVNS